MRPLTLLSVEDGGACSEKFEVVGQFNMAALFAGNAGVEIAVVAGWPLLIGVDAPLPPPPPPPQAMSSDNDPTAIIEVFIIRCCTLNLPGHRFRLHCYG